jgi:uncharacterized protein (DUF736 family)
MPKKAVEVEAEVPEEPAQEAPVKGQKPDFRVVQAERGPDGETKFRNVGGMWKKTSKNGNDFYSMGIGKMRLLVFPNEKKS